MKYARFSVGWTNHLKELIRVRFCSHRYYVEDGARISDTRVDYPCYKCGHVASVVYRLLLISKLDRKEP